MVGLLFGLLTRDDSGLETERGAMGHPWPRAITSVTRPRAAHRHGCTPVIGHSRQRLELVAEARRGGTRNRAECNALRQSPRGPIGCEIRGRCGCRYSAAVRGFGHSRA